MKKVCVVTATRAEYGLLKNTIRCIEQNENLELILTVTGTHLCSNFGHTIDEIKEDGFAITAEIPIIEDGDDGDVGITRIMARAMERFGEFFSDKKPDMLVVLGDRYELFAICGAAMIGGIAIAHISGGEVTEGAIDDNIRHCITKMSTLHFPGCEEYRKRIIQLGEQPAYVFNYGDVGVENIRNTQFLKQEELENYLGIPLEHCISMTFHPVTTQMEELEKQLDQVLCALDELPEYTFVISKANADNGGVYINRKLERFCERHDNCHIFASLGIQRYLSLIKIAKAVVGNSSSGIVEAPVLHTPTVNIGERQKGRLMADSIICCDTATADIVAAIRKAVSAEWQNKARNTISLYGEGRTSQKIVDEICNFLNSDSKTPAKKFYDIYWEKD